VTCLPTLLTAAVVIAVSLLGGCSDTAIGTAGEDARASVGTEDRAASRPASPQTAEKLASIALDDHRLSEVRGGFETSSGVVLNFAFQQATFVNHSLAQNVVTPTLTISPSQGTSSVAGTLPVRSNVNLGSLAGLGVSGSPTTSMVNTATILPNGTVQAQVSAAAPLIQALVNSGMTSIVSTAGSNGLTNVISNTASNQLIQQVTTVDVGITGLSKLIQQSIPSTVLNRLTGPSSFR
jgi:hypothetical protein